jgi:hypothetical protein
MALAFLRSLSVAIFLCSSRRATRDLLALSEILGNLAWAILAFIVAIILGWKLFRYFRPAVSVTA